MILLKAIAWFSACPGVALQHPKRCFLSLILQNWTLQLQEVIKEMVSFDKSAPNCECVSPAPRGWQCSHHRRCRCVNEVTFSWNTSAHWPQLVPSDTLPNSSVIPRCTISGKIRHLTPLLQQGSCILERFMGESTKAMKALEEPEVEEEKNANW